DPAGAGPAAAGPAPAPGSCLGDYELLQELGKGGMGIVYKARQRGVNRLVALKVIRADKLEDLEADERQRWVQRFHHEAQAVGDLPPPNVVTLYEVGEQDGHPYFSMELLEAGSLAGLIRQARQAGVFQGAGLSAAGQRDAARLMAEVARAVHF